MAKKNKLTQVAEKIGGALAKPIERPTKSWRQEQSQRKSSGDLETG